MAGAMLRRWIDTGMDTSGLRVVDPAMPELPGGLIALRAEIYPILVREVTTARGETRRRSMESCIYRTCAKRALAIS